MKRILICLLLLQIGGAAAGDAHEPRHVEPLRLERVSDDPVAHGERLASVLGCIGCHGRELTGKDWSDPEMGVLWTANLTQSAARFSAEELTTMIVEGRRPDRALMDMPSVLFSEIHPDDIAALVAYLKTLEPRGAVHPEPTIGPTLEREIASGEFLDSVQTLAAHRDVQPPDAGAAHRQGRHIARATCVECHGADLRGGAGPMADAPRPPDLRMVAAYGPADFEKLMRTGKALGDRELKLMSSVARYRYSRFTDGEIDALYGYLVAVARGAREADHPP